MSAAELSTRPEDEVQLVTGEKGWIPPELRAAMAEAMDAARAQADAGASTQVFLDHLVAGLHSRHVALVPLAFHKSTDAVSTNVYAMALAAKYAADMKLFEVRMAVDDSPTRGTLFAEFQAVIDALTGHAPPLKVVEQIALLEDRLRLLRRVVLGTPMHEPLIGGRHVGREEGDAA